MLIGNLKPTILLVALGMNIACTPHAGRPTAAIINFYDGTLKHQELCKILSIGAVIDAAKPYEKQFLSDLPQLTRFIRTGRNPPPQRIYEPAPLIQAGLSAAQDCNTDGIKHTDKLFAEALASISSADQKTQLANYYEEWKKFLSALAPVPPDMTKTYPVFSPDEYLKRIDSALQPANTIWNNYVLQARDPEDFCSNELSTLKGNSKISDEERRIVNILAPSYSISTKDLEDLKKSTIRIGMSKCAAIALWGKATKKKLETNAAGKTEILYYGANKALTVKDGRLISASE